MGDWKSYGTQLNYDCGGEASCATLYTSASKSSIRRFVITEKAPTRAFSWLKAAITAFTFKTLSKHNANPPAHPICPFNQEKALVGAFSVITNLRMDLFEALVNSCGSRM